MKRIASIAIVVLLLVGAAFGLRQCRSGGAETFQTAAVMRGPITQAVSATGTLNPVVNVQVGSQVSGNIQKLFVDFNSPVKEGEVVAQIDPILFQANVAQAEGELANAKAGLELAQLNAGRIESLVAKQSSAQADLDQARASLHQAEANVQIKQGALDKVRADLENSTIRSPIDGVVISRSVDVGQTVAASLQAPILFTIANDLANMQIDANVAEADIGSVAVDQKVDFTVDAFPNQTFQGKVTQVRNAPINVQNVVSYDTVIGVKNPEMKLKPGMTANVSIIAAHQDEVLKVSNAALRFRPADDKAATAKPAARGGGERSSPRWRPRKEWRRCGEKRVIRTVYVLGKDRRRTQGGADQDRNQRRRFHRSDGGFTGRRSSGDGCAYDRQGKATNRQSVQRRWPAARILGASVMPNESNAASSFVWMRCIRPIAPAKWKCRRCAAFPWRFIAANSSRSWAPAVPENRRLMNLLGCLDRPTRGRYFLDGADVSQLERDQRADIRNGKLGFVFQSFNLLPRTSARENVELPLLYGTRQLTNAELRAKADAVLAAVGLQGREDHHPEPAFRWPATAGRDRARARERS